MAQNKAKQGLRGGGPPQCKNDLKQTTQGLKNRTFSSRKLSSNQHANMARRVTKKIKLKEEKGVTLEALQQQQFLQPKTNSYDPKITSKALSSNMVVCG